MLKLKKLLTEGEDGTAAQFADKSLIKTHANSQLIKESFQKIAKIK
tara:strand:- start:296 stop:433 length:138 start_codon:yes stop_codon:yes gene_type:complete